MLRCGIVGLPNVGKSTLFNALGAAKAESANYPFCTIEPNVSMVNVPDARLLEIAQIFAPDKITHAVTEFVDIAGLVKGASKGEGLGNQFLSHIRQTDAILHLVRCFQSEEVVHVEGGVDPLRDIEVIDTELALADLQTVEKRLTRERNAAKSGKKEHAENAEQLEALQAHLDAGKPARTFDAKLLEAPVIRDLFLLTAKPVLFVANATGADAEKAFRDQVQAHAEKEGAQFSVIDCSLEAEIAQLESEEREEYLRELGLEEPGLNRLIRSAFDLLGLMTFYTAGKKEVRAWTLPKGSTAPQAAGQIHSDFERGFICAECYKSEELLRLGSESKLREAGLLRQEGKEYLVQPDDVLLFRFNV